MNTKRLYVFCMVLAASNVVLALYLHNLAAVFGWASALLGWDMARRLKK